MHPYYENIAYHQERMSNINNNNNVKETNSQTSIIDQMEISDHTISLPIKKNKCTTQLIKNTIVDIKETRI